MKTFTEAMASHFVYVSDPDIVLEEMPLRRLLAMAFTRGIVIGMEMNSPEMPTVASE